MILASFGAIGAVLLTTDDESNTGNKQIDYVYMVVSKFDLRLTEITQ